MADSSVTVTAVGIDFKTRALEIAYSLVMGVFGSPSTEDDARKQALLIYELQQMIQQGEPPSRG